MENIFLTILNMSLVAGFVIIVIILARLLLKKSPKVISYALWAVVGFRLLVPLSFETAFSLVPFDAAPLTQQLAATSTSAIHPQADGAPSSHGEILGMQEINAAAPYSRVPNDSGIYSASAESSALSDINTYEGILLFRGRSISQVQGTVASESAALWLTLGTYIWLIGTAAMLTYSIISVLILKRKLRSAEPVSQNIYQAKNLKTPFVIGILNPKIYLPMGLCQNERNYALLHEQAHISRKDYLVKILAYFTLCIHWFNPLVWIAFVLMGKDMEMSCDERVIKKLGEDIKHDYSEALVSLASEKRFIAASPLAFGEGGMKHRVKNILNFKKHSRIIVVASVALAAILTVGLALNRLPDAEAIDAVASENDLQNGNALVPEAPDSGFIDTNEIYVVFEIEDYRFENPEEFYNRIAELLSDISEDYQNDGWELDRDGMFEVRVFYTFEEANNHSVFPIAVPEILPEGVTLDHVRISRTSERGILAGLFHPDAVRFTYLIETDDDFRLRGHNQAFLVFSQLQFQFGSASDHMEFLLRELQQHEASSNETTRFDQTFVNGNNALFLLSHVPEIPASAEPLTLSASLQWADGDILHGINVFAPIEIVNEDMLIKIAESMG